MSERSFRRGFPSSGLSQNPGFAKIRSNSAKRFFLASMSKIPPEGLEAFRKFLQRRLDVTHIDIHLKVLLR